MRGLTEQLGAFVEGDERLDDKAFALC